MAQGDFDRSLCAALSHRSFTEAAGGALCSMIGWLTDGIADEADFSGLTLYGCS